MVFSRLLHKLNMLLSYPLWIVKHNSISLYSDISSGLMARYTHIDKYVFIGRNCTISSTSIGAYSCIAADTQIGGMEHPYWDLTISPRLSEQFVYGKRTIIGHDVWIGSGCIIRQGVTIGDGAVIGANSFVNKDVPSYTIVAGTPAAPLKVREAKKIEKQLQDSRYWELNPDQAKAILQNIKESNHD